VAGPTSPRRRRRHAAATSRIVVAGLSASLALGLVGTFALERSAAQANTPPPTTTAPAPVDPYEPYTPSYDTPTYRAPTYRVQPHTSTRGS
jgi:hypothetical protein